MEECTDERVDGWEGRWDSLSKWIDGWIVEWDGR